MSAFRLDRRRAKLMGVCAGIADAVAIDPLLVRIAAIVALLALGPLVILVYLLTGWLAR